MKTGNQKYRNPKARSKYQTEFIKDNYKVLIFRVHKKKDKHIIKYFSKASNKTQALRKLYYDAISNPKRPIYDKKGKIILPKNIMTTIGCEEEIMTVMELNEQIKNKERN